MADMRDDESDYNPPECNQSTVTAPVNERSSNSMVYGMASKIPSTFNGTGSWFVHEDLIDDRCDLTPLEPEK